jgi:hypothetical protein
MRLARFLFLLPITLHLCGLKFEKIIQVILSDREDYFLNVKRWW